MSRVIPWIDKMPFPSIWMQFESAGVFEEARNSIDLDGWWSEVARWDDPTYEAQRVALTAFENQCAEIFSGPRMLNSNVYIFLPDRLMEISDFYPTWAAGSAYGGPLDMVYVKGYGVAIHRAPVGGTP